MPRTRLAVVATAILLTVSLAGCLDVLDAAVERVRGSEPPPKDTSQSFRAHVLPDHETRHEFHVEEGARLVKVEAALTMRSDAPVPWPFTPAEVTFTVQDPAGSRVGDVLTLTASAPEGTIAVDHPETAGTFILLVEGRGASNGEQGAAYDATVLVKY